MKSTSTLISGGLILIASACTNRAMESKAPSFAHVHADRTTHSHNFQRVRIQTTIATFASANN